MKALIILLHALVLWGLCGATIAIGRSIMSMETTLIVHAIGATIFAVLVSYNYFKRFSHTNPFQTAIIFLLFIIIMDAGLVAPVFEGSYDMFKNPLGTWIPFVLIFFATYLTGKYLNKKK